MNRWNARVLSRAWSGIATVAVMVARWYGCSVIVPGVTTGIGVPAGASASTGDAVTRTMWVSGPQLRTRRASVAVPPHLTRLTTSPIFVKTQHGGGISQQPCGVMRLAWVTSGRPMRSMTSDAMRSWARNSSWTVSGIAWSTDVVMVASYRLGRAGGNVHGDRQPGLSAQRQRAEVGAARLQRPPELEGQRELAGVTRCEGR